MKFHLIVALGLVLVGIVTALYISACRLVALFDAIDRGDA
jgi:hypothetical protein